METKIFIGDVLAVARGLPPSAYDSVLCDPPYGLSFMGHEWDHGVPSIEVWSEILRVLKPGGFLLAFGGTRTYHRLTCAIEDAGFEIRDCLMWLYGSGFPKGLNISKEFDKKAGATRPLVDGARPNAQHKPGNTTYKMGMQGTNGYAGETAPVSDQAKRWDDYNVALKPAWEPCIVAMKPCEGPFVVNAETYQVAGLNIGGCRIGTETIQINTLPGWSGFGQEKRPDYTPRQSAGRWPANVIIDPIVADMIDAQAPTAGGGKHPRRCSAKDKSPAKGAEKARVSYGHGDSGGASRFFYCAKASKKERNAGLDDLPEQGKIFNGQSSAPAACAPGSVEAKFSTQPQKNYHPTVKPLALMEYLARLLLPPERDGAARKILVPFSGSGSEMIGAGQAGFETIHGIEINPEYANIADSRLGYWLPQRRSKMDTWDWIRQVAAGHEHASWMSFIHVTSYGVAYGTNGHRMHYGQVDKPEGMYDPTVGWRVADKSPHIADIEKARPNFSKMWNTPSTKFITGRTDEGVGFASPPDSKLKVPLTDFMDAVYIDDQPDILIAHNDYQIAGENSLGFFVIMCLK